MTNVFISYARSTEPQARHIAEALKALGYDVWRDDELPAHRAYTEVIDERLAAAKAVVVIWSADAAKSEWVQSEADTARTDHKLVQVTVDGSKLPRPFDRIQCADLAGWTGDLEAPGWRKVVASIADLAGRPAVEAAAAAPAAPVLELPSKPSIAVMPFANLSGDPEQEYFADGMVEEITTALSRSRSIFVIASGSAFSLKGTGVGPEEAARRLGVRYVLEGSVRRAANRVRIAVKLIDASDGSQIWAERFEGTLEDVFALQDNVALSVAGVIEPAVREAEIRRVSKRPTDNMGSYDLYLRAIPLVRAVGREERLRALELLNRAIALDPDNGRALSFAASTYFFHIREGWSDDPDGDGRRRVEFAHRALKVAGDDPVVLASAGTALRSESLEAATAMVDRSLSLNPGSSNAWFVSGQIRAEAGELELAAAHFETSMRLDPLSPLRVGQLYGLGEVRFQQGRFAEAVGLLVESSHLMPDWKANYGVLAACYGHLGQVQAGTDALARFRSRTLSSMQDWYEANSRRPESRRLFHDGIALLAGTDPPKAGGGA